MPGTGLLFILFSPLSLLELFYFLFVHFIRTQSRPYNTHFLTPLVHTFLFLLSLNNFVTSLSPLSLILVSGGS